MPVPQSVGPSVFSNPDVIRMRREAEQVQNRDASTRAAARGIGSAGIDRTQRGGPSSHKERAASLHSGLACPPEMFLLVLDQRVRLNKGVAISSVPMPNA